VQSTALLTATVTATPMNPGELSWTVLPFVADSPGFTGRDPSSTLGAMTYVAAAARLLRSARKPLTLASSAIRGSQWPSLWSAWPLNCKRYSCIGWGRVGAGCVA
jgi:hypothetical protein